MQKKIKTYSAKKSFFTGGLCLFFITIFFYGSAAPAHALAEEVILGGGNPALGAAVKMGVSAVGSGAVEFAGDALSTVVNTVLYALLWVLTGLMQMAATLFAWATKPEYISGPTGFLNLDSVYSLWKFIRDFFNLFFIFLLLFSAFATVFQVEQFGLKKNFFKIILAAIAINFSFPLTRIIIDLGNVPMYFFADGIKSGTGAGNSLLDVPQAFFKSSGITDLVFLPNQPIPDMNTAQLLAAVIFTFIFTITLVALAFLFVLRLLKLIIILIFSPVGIAASLVPGLKKFGNTWWSELWKTVLFGPAAMLMIVIALRFTLEIRGSSLASGLSASAPAASSGSQASIISQGLFFIPVILMWMAMGVGSKFGLQGADVVMKKANSVAAWGKRQAMRPVNATGRGIKRTGKAVVSPVTTRWKGATAGLKKRAYEGRIFGDEIKKATGGRLGYKAWKESGEDLEAKYKGFFDKGKRGVESERKKAENRRISAKMKEFKDDLLERSDLEKKLLDSKGDETDKKAAALLLAETKEGIKTRPDVLAAALALFEGDPDRYDKVRTSTDDDVWGMSDDQYDRARLAGVRTNTKKEGLPEDEAVAGKVTELLSQKNDALENTIKNQAEPLYAAAKANIDALIAGGMKAKDATAMIVNGMSDDDQALYHVGKMNEKTLLDFGKQIKKTGGDIDRLFEYQLGSNKSFSNNVPDENKVTIEEVEKLYKQHKFTPKDIAQQSTLLKNAAFQQYAINTWKPGQVSELMKAMGGNKDQGAHDAFDNIKRGVGG